ncbi:ParB/Srx family N-terminal domain-containing protein [Rhodococcus kronopolitis]|uniref:ParB/Srx family N-terminal domain-containing protein n=1 Tax=Rhodococcus kronopolitis TaxID=1460226 RepID=A0ABV9FQJ3_9NOCA
MSLTSRRALTTLAAFALVGAGTLGATGTALAEPDINSPSCGPSAGSASDLFPNGSSSGSAAGFSDSPFRCSEVGDLIDVRIGDVRATQPSLGYDEVYYKLGRYTLGKDEINKKFDDWCEANGQVKAVTVTPGAKIADPGSFTCELPVGQETAESVAPMKTVVIGPAAKLYLTDGHHTLTSFYETEGPDVHVRLRVLANLSTFTVNNFWAEMKKNGWVWNHDVDGKEVPVTSLPAGVGLANFADDRYRSLMYFARDIGFTPGTIPFQEFYWGAWLRDAKAADLSGWNTRELASYLDTVKRVTKAQTALPADTVVGGGFTAAQLGALAQWNDGKTEDKGEFAKLSKPYSDGKPGKIAYALEYKAAHGK